MIPGALVYRWATANKLRFAAIENLGLDPFDARFTGSYLHSFTKRSERRIRDLCSTSRSSRGLATSMRTRSSLV